MHMMPRRIFPVGLNANYIPYLANIDSDLFGLSVTLVDGTSISIGDTRTSSE